MLPRRGARVVVLLLCASASAAAAAAALEIFPVPNGPRSGGCRARAVGNGSAAAAPRRRRRRRRLAPPADRGLLLPRLLSRPSRSSYLEAAGVGCGGLPSDRRRASAADEGGDVGEVGGASASGPYPALIEWLRSYPAGYVNPRFGIRPSSVGGGGGGGGGGGATNKR